MGVKKQNRPQMLAAGVQLFVLREFALVRRRQLMTALLAARGQNRATTAGGHALEKSMFPEARNALWLVCSLRHRNPRSAPDNDASIPNKKPPLQTPSSATAKRRLYGYCRSPSN
jgi:hypothetical protein